MSGAGRKRNLLSGGPKGKSSRPNATSSNTDLTFLTPSTSSIVPDSLQSSVASSQVRQTRQSTLSQRTLEPFSFTQTRSLAKSKAVISEADDDDDIQIIEEPKSKRKKGKDIDEFEVPDSLDPITKNSERQVTPFTSVQTSANKGRKSKQFEVIPDSIAEVDESDNVPSTSANLKRSQKRAGLDKDLGEAVKAVKKIKLSTGSTSDFNTISMKTKIRSAPPGKTFQKARQGSFYLTQTVEKIPASAMNVWNG